MVLKLQVLIYRENKKIVWKTRWKRLLQGKCWMVMIYLPKRMAQKYDLLLSLLPPNLKRRRQYLLPRLLHLRMSLEIVVSGGNTNANRRRLIRSHWIQLNLKALKRRSQQTVVIHYLWCRLGLQRRKVGFPKPEEEEDKRRITSLSERCFASVCYLVNCVNPFWLYYMVCGFHSIFDVEPSIITVTLIFIFLQPKPFSVFNRKF